VSSSSKDLEAEAVAVDGNVAPPGSEVALPRRASAYADPRSPPPPHDPTHEMRLVRVEVPPVAGAPASGASDAAEAAQRRDLRKLPTQRSLKPPAAPPPSPPPAASPWRRPVVVGTALGIALFAAGLIGVGIAMSAATKPDGRVIATVTPAAAADISLARTASYADPPRAPSEEPDNRTERASAAASISPKPPRVKAPPAPPTAAQPPDGPDLKRNVPF
jgi:hypothetical protein